MKQELCEEPKVEIVASISGVDVKLIYSDGIVVGVDRMERHTGPHIAPVVSVRLMHGDFALARTELRHTVQ